MRAELEQHVGTRGLNLNRPQFCIKAKTKQKTGSLDLKKAYGIDNQGLLKSWMLLLSQKRKMNAKNNKHNKAD
jgi:hypothetical protein